MEYLDNLANLFASITSKLSAGADAEQMLIYVAIAAIGLGVFMMIIKALRKLAFIAIMLGVLSMFASGEMVDIGSIKERLSGLKDIAERAIESHSY